MIGHALKCVVSFFVLMWYMHGTVNKQVVGKIGNFKNAWIVGKQGNS